jgi:hypothetical protein
MTQDDIVVMARQAGFEGCAELTWEDVICTDELIAFAKLVAQHEREACALLCYEQRKHWDALACADAIRAGTRPRGQA